MKAGKAREMRVNVECLPDFFGGFALNHVRDSLATSVDKGFDVHMIGGLDPNESAIIGKMEKAKGKG
jgi:hypothetical protein